MRHEGELVSEYAMRLRTLAIHCKFRVALDKEIERQFVVACEMDEAQRKCSRSDNLALATVLDIANNLSESTQVSMFLIIRHSSKKHEGLRLIIRIREKHQSFYKRRTIKIKPSEVRI